ncbi:MAG: FkbM family methyltransferase [Daejeonella sp.]|uniref:FkbM family methyltransferase n=1 Tax=Daejeonella sp. TaxID=2805397 RepID=UPI0027325552|nr:FkbM family methyltransferase [Daejeonella sp.]MDP3469203.1 FkbM family methyltransferase [Daejeonella sp.]
MKRTEPYTSLINPARIKTLLSFGIKGYLSEIGWFKSFETKSPIGRNSEPIPWVTYSFIDFIADRIQKEHLVFEFGSGNSTFYYAKRAQKVVSVEHDKAWFDKISASKPLNSEMIFCELQKDGEYSKMPESIGIKFDIIIIDGRDRVNCSYNSLGALSEKGVIVLDDSERHQYSAAVNFLKNEGFRELSFSGISPGLFYRKSTSVFYKDNNCLGI